MNLFYVETKPEWNEEALLDLLSPEYTGDEPFVVCMSSQSSVDVLMSLLSTHNNSSATESDSDFQCGKFRVLLLCDGKIASKSLEACTRKAIIVHFDLPKILAVFDARVRLVEPVARIAVVFLTMDFIEDNYKSKFEELKIEELPLTTLSNME